MSQRMNVFLNTLTRIYHRILISQMLLKPDSVQSKNYIQEWRSKQSTVEMNSQKPFEIVEENIILFSDIVQKCVSNFYSKLQLVDLQNAIKSIDNTMHVYPGGAKQHLDPLRSRCTLALRTYNNCVNLVFENCSSISNTFDVFLASAGQKDLVAGDKEILWTPIAKSLSKGKANISKSMEMLCALKTEVSSLKELFNSMLQDIKTDFTEIGMCTTTMQNLKARDEKAKERERASKKKAFFKDLCDAVLAWIKNDEVAKKLNPVIGEGLDLVIKHPESASFEQQIKIINFCSEHLHKEITKAISTVDMVLQNLRVLHKPFDDLENLSSNGDLATIVNVSTFVEIK